jgi:hypothetical protein
MSSSATLRRRTAAAGLVCGALACAVTTVWTVSGIVDSIHGNPLAPWLLGRASGFTAYMLMWSLVVLGLLLSHPGAARMRRVSRLTRLRVHFALAVFTLAFTTLHVVVLATDRWAGVGWRGAVLPMASEYRPVPVTLGLLALWSGVVTGVTARLAGRRIGRFWWPIHKVAAVAFWLVWWHGLLAGSDTLSLTWLYLATGLLVLVVGVSRYAARTPDDDLAELASGDDARLVTAEVVRR